MSQTTAPEATGSDENSEKKETLNREILETNDDAGTRRVRRTYRRTVRDPADLPFIEAGDTFIRDTAAETLEDEIVAVGSDLSSIGGLHIQTDAGDTIHMSLVGDWLSDNNVIIHGERTETFTEVENVDY